MPRDPALAVQEAAAHAAKPGKRAAALQWLLDNQII